MRKIEFRGLNTSGEWVYGSYVSYYEGHHEIHCKIDPEDDFNGYPVNGGTVGQYTGIKDSNGVKIFDGDTVGTDLEVGDVKYINEQAAFCLVDDGDFICLLSNAINPEVIGNINEKA